MKKYLLAAALVMVSASAMADRVVSGSTNYDRWDMADKASACESAKHVARKNVKEDEEVEAYSKCECDQDDKRQWHCSVDAKVAKKR